VPVRTSWGEPARVLSGAAATPIAQQPRPEPPVLSRTTVAPHSLHRLQRWGRPASIQRLRFRRVEEHGQAKRAAWGRQPVRLPLGTGALMLEKRSTEPSAL
jgi:hypothetical protein